MFRFRVHFRARLAVAAVVAAVLSGTPAEAQGLFDWLFGGSAPKASSPSSPAQGGGHMTPGGRPSVTPQSYAPRHRGQDDDDDRHSKGPQYRTVCVRLCDGYFFPVSNAASRKFFYRDQMRCNSMCGEEARLFHLPVNSSEMDKATDQSGRPYTGLKMAFAYRKAQVPGCQCKPEPWSDATAARHQKYADAAEPERIKAAQAAIAEMAVDEQRVARSAVTAPAPAVVVAAASAAPAANGSAAEKTADASDLSGRPEPIKVLNQRTAKWSATARSAQRQAAPPVRMATVAKPFVQPSSLQGGMALGAGATASKWPGDPQRR